MSTTKLIKPTNTTPKSIKINTKEYYSTEDLNNYDTSYFTGTHRNLRGIVKKKNIPESAIAYAYYKDDKLVISTESYVRAKLYLEAEWVKSNIPKMIQLKNKSVQPIQPIQPIQTVSRAKISKKVIPSVVPSNDIKSDNKIEEIKLEEIKLEEDIDIESLYEVPPAPGLLHLSEEEMFKDSEGNLIEIEVRGEREHTKCYFKVKDVMKGFEMPSLNELLTDKRKDGYHEEEHYKYFTIIIPAPGGKNVSKKELFLTYEGMIRLLYVSRSKNAKVFRNWASETLFINQMGSVEQKDKLVSKIKGVSYENIQELFSINARTLPCVYLTAFNDVKTLRNSMNIDSKYNDDDIVYKFGLTSSFENRKNGKLLEILLYIMI